MLSSTHFSRGRLSQSTDPIGQDLELVKHEPFNAETPTSALANAITPTTQIFVRSNFAVPALAGEAHRLAITGMVAHAFDISVGELRSLRQLCSDVTMTMECAGNGRIDLCPLPTGELWADGAVSTSRWTGLPLRILLERAEVDANAIEILVEGADTGPTSDGSTAGFGRSLSIADAMRDDVLLAFDVNGGPLTAAHGAPLRLIVPGWYGMASVKWVTRISALPHHYEGYFQSRRYIYDEPGQDPTPVTRVRVKSMITSPAAGTTIARGVIDIAGWAWTGNGSIARVEVAIDGGSGWRDAELLQRDSNFAWTRWMLRWEPDHGGRHALRSRATDSAGNTQPDAISWNRLGYGNNAVRPLVLRIE